MKTYTIALIFLLLSSCSFSPQFIPLFKGDCATRAIELRNYLRGQGYESEIVIGRIIIKGQNVGHAWIRYRKPGTTKWDRYPNLRADL
jgi:hypothetical protein